MVMFVTSKGWCDPTCTVWLRRRRRSEAEEDWVRKETRYPNIINKLPHSADGDNNGFDAVMMREDFAGAPGGRGHFADGETKHQHSRCKHAD